MATETLISSGNSPLTTEDLYEILYELEQIYGGK